MQKKKKKTGKCITGMLEREERINERNIYSNISQWLCKNNGRHQTTDLGSSENTK